MKNKKECINLAVEIKELENKISEREGPFEDGSKLMFSVADETTDKNTIKLQKLKKKYDLICK